MTRRIPCCPQCGTTRIVRVDRYDAMACRRCNLWIESRCSLGDDCDSGYCNGRPETPAGANWDDPNNTRYGSDDDALPPSTSLKLLLENSRPIDRDRDACTSCGEELDPTPLRLDLLGRKYSASFGDRLDKVQREYAAGRFVADLRIHLHGNQDGDSVIAECEQLGVTAEAATVAGALADLATMIDATFRAREANPHVGSTFESWLDEDGSRERVDAMALGKIARRERLGSPGDETADATNNEGQPAANELALRNEAEDDAT